MKVKQKGLIRLLVAAVLAAGLLVIALVGVGDGALSVRQIQQGLDLAGGVSIVLQADEPNPTVADMRSAETMIRGRLDRRGYTEAHVSRMGANRLQVEIPGVEDPEDVIGEVIRVGRLTFREPIAGPDGFMPGEVLFDGAHITNARHEVFQDHRGVHNVVGLEFDSQGTTLFADATARFMGSPIFIMMDDDVLSAPTVNAVIPDGRAIIEGNFTPASASDLADWIRAGSLPFGLEILSINLVGAQLGEYALRTSITAGLVGIAAVLLFMIFVYRAAGFAASLALIIYAGLMLVVLSLFQVTLTLPGIAGIVLSVGMAVDANIVIFSRLKEEMADGRRSFASAVDAAFKRALPAILDGNVTTLVAAIILFILGTGPVMGFAMTLSIGIVLSMLTAIFVTRMILKSFGAVGINKHRQYGIILMEVGKI